MLEAGLDEIRFHPPPNLWGKISKTKIAGIIRDSVNLDIDVAVEIPSIPGMKKEIFSLITWADTIGVKWVNLNELEFSETNEETLLKHGFEVKSSVSAAVKGSMQTSLDILKMVLKENLDIGVHFCSCSFKDGIQLRNRIKRRAENIVKQYQYISEDGTLIYGIITSPKVKLRDIYHSIIEKYEFDYNLLKLDFKKIRIEIAADILEQIANDLKQDFKDIGCYIIEEYPTADHLEVERIPLK